MLIRGDSRVLAGLPDRALLVAYAIWLFALLICGDSRVQKIISLLPKRECVVYDRTDSLYRKIVRYTMKKYRKEEKIPCRV